MYFLNFSTILFVSALVEEGVFLKVVVAPDSFKGSLTAVQAAQAMAAGICDAIPLSRQLCFLRLMAGKER